MRIDGVEITAEGFTPSKAELQAYVDYVTIRVDDVDSIRVVMCSDGKVDVHWSK